MSVRGGSGGSSGGGSSGNGGNGVGGLEEVEAALEGAVRGCSGAGRRCAGVGAGLAARARLVGLRAAAGPSTLAQPEREALMHLVSASREALRLVTAEHRALHLSVSRLGKSIDRQLVGELGPAAPCHAAFLQPPLARLLDQAVLLHLYREGCPDLAETLIKESGVTVPERAPQIRQFQTVVRALMERDPQPALAWLQENADETSHSELAFKLHRLIFKKLTQTEGHVAAIYYAQKNFPPFVSKHEKEIQRTMCLLIYDNETLPSTHSGLHDDFIWNDCLELFLKDAAVIMNYPSGSTIRDTVDIGSDVIPMLFNIHSKMLQTHKEYPWGNTDELPVEIVNDDHSLFACPILRQQSTESNPPMRLFCGHVISKEALNKLCRNSRLKCPYCPTEQSRADAKILYF